MYRIVEARVLGRNIKLFKIQAPRIAKKQRPGQFVIVRLHENGERIPLTIEGSDTDKGTVTLVVQAMGKTTHLMNQLEAGDSILDIVGPLGKPSEIENYGTAVVIGGSVGTAIALPVARALKQAGNHVIGITGSRSKDLLVLVDELTAATSETFVMTDDGSAGEKGFVTRKLQELVDTRKVDYVVAIGPVPMMKAVAEVTRHLGIKTVVSLNSIMVDGTGMCGGCRVLVGAKNEFACVDGPEFDAHTVDYDILMKRNMMYREMEQRSLNEFLADPQAEVAKVREACRLREVEEKAATEASHV